LGLGGSGGNDDSITAHSSSERRGLLIHPVDHSLPRFC
jgi:hypothetical protein